MNIPIINSRNLPNTWRILDDKLGTHRERGLPFRFGYTGAFSQHVAEFFIKVYSNPGDIILDLFAGRGTTAMQSLWGDRHIICNDLSPFSSVLCHSIMWPVRASDCVRAIDYLEEYINSHSEKISNKYAGKGSDNDCSKLYEESTFKNIVKLRNLLNSRDILLGKLGFDGFEDIKYRHEIIMFLRMVFSQLMIGSSDLCFNGIKIRGSDNTNIRALLRYYDLMNQKPKRVNIFDCMKEYVEKMGLEEIGIINRFRKLNRNLMACDARKLNLPDKCVDLVLTSPPYFHILSYGMSNWLRFWSIDNIGDPLIKNYNIKINENSNSEIYGKIYDKVTGSTGSTVDNANSYSSFTGLYLRELYRILKDDSAAIIIVGDYGSKRKIEAWKLVSDRANIFGFKTDMVIMDELNKDTKSSSQFNIKQGGGKNDYDVCVVLTKGGYKIKNDPEKLDFQWSTKFADRKQLSQESAWGI